ncbi:ATP-grasp ribosomal peptide maturase [Kribbella solani]|uniref:ATP-grasp ribosomal peptide maturase n=1 Tax=Kribbella solani TaxID=236067 RepID=UPI0029B5CBD4|nr:ATP-grasp ribosomal peptide maturase [Kribbella solani]MDX3001476.1 ATP-grasp ribosomal peptide maturase [Kribbella solani]
MDAGTRPVMVITEIDDPTADLVIEELNERQVEVIRFDAADFPSSLSVSANLSESSGWDGLLRTPTRRAHLAGVRSLYYRRPTDFDFSHLELQDARFAASQARYGLGGILSSLPGCLYVNHPTAIADAEYKPAQLSVAASNGFSVLPTIITNTPDDAREFAAIHGRIVYKPLYVGAYDLAGRPASIWVREVTAEMLDDSVAGTMHLFQARCDKVADLRVTVIGDQVFCVRIDRGDRDLLDWRYDYDQLTYSAVEAPTGLAASLRRYLDRFGLVFGCFDFAITRDDRLDFLECNPNGQWGWLEDETGLRMTAALADLLAGGVR